MHPQGDRNRLLVVEVALRRALRRGPQRRHLRSLPSKHLATEGANPPDLASGRLLSGRLSVRRGPSRRPPAVAKEETERLTWVRHKEVLTACHDSFRTRMLRADC